MSDLSFDEARAVETQVAHARAYRTYGKGRHWLVETAIGNTRLLATGLRDTVCTVSAHASFDRLGHYVQFHSGHTHETIALITLRELPALKGTK